MEDTQQVAVTAPESAPVTEPAPASEPPKADAPAPEATKEEPKAEPQLYPLPDGRMVDGETLAREWKSNFLPDYTRKSQELSRLTKAAPVQQPAPTAPAEQVPKWKDPNWEPTTYAEVIEAAKLALKDEMAEEARQREETQNQINSWVDGQLAEIRKMEPNVSEDLLFQHANKYKFPDLIAAYNNMKDMSMVVKKTEQKVLQNVQKREEPIAAKPNVAAPSTGIDLSVLDRNETPLEYLARIKSN